MADIKIKRKSYRNDKSFQPNHLHLELSGKDVNYVLVNTIRRVILSNIPCYAFNEINIDYASIGKLMRENDYRGYISLEFEGNEDANTAVPKSLKLLRDSFYYNLG